MKKIWINATGRSYWYPEMTHTVCSEHFTVNDFILKKSNRKFLKRDAIPSKNIMTCSMQHLFQQPTEINNENDHKQGEKVMTQTIQDTIEIIDERETLPQEIMQRERNAQYLREYRARKGWFDLPKYGGNDHQLGDVTANLLTSDTGQTHDESIIKEPSDNILDEDQLQNETKETMASPMCGKDEGTNEENFIECTTDRLSWDIKKLFNANVKVSDVEKFKRRLIRTVAGKLGNDVPEKELWDTLQKHTGCDCMMLWKRMRVLTIKKLRRLLLAEDRLDGVTKIARLSATDWLFFDLVLVHEKIDVIGQDTITEKTKEPQGLQELFALVKKYNIEHLSGDELIKAWVYLTLEYNNSGRQSSPMLLQRRWYQMKDLTKNKFYLFWYTYRGSAVKLDKAMEDKPTDLQVAIAREFVTIVTETFHTWEELIQMKKVILREDFEKLAVKQANNKGSNPDVEVIENPVETIDIDDDSDAENPKSVKVLKTQNQSKQGELDSKGDDGPFEIRINKIKSEVPAENLAADIYSGVDALELTHIPLETDAVSETNLIINDDPEMNNVIEDDDLIPIDNMSEVPVELDSEIVLPKITSVTGGVQIIEDDIDEDDALIKITQKNKNNENDKKGHNLSMVNDSNLANTSVIPPSEDSDNVLNPKSDVEKKEYEVELNDLIIIDDGIALEDDCCEYIREEICENDLPRTVEAKGNKECDNDTTHEVSTTSADVDIKTTPKFDFKLLLMPVVYTKKLDDMDVFKFIDYDKVCDIRVIEYSLIESKPKDVKAVDTSKIVEDIADMRDNYSDNKSLTSTDTQEEINTNTYDDNLRKVKLSSWILQKPKNRSYNSIQLCKNPDFNTRLKRLTTGFLSSERNRLFLKECKPITIDLHKAFESRLTDGVMYLKDGKFRNISEVKGIESSPLPINVKTLPSLVEERAENINIQDNLLNLMQTSVLTASQPHENEPEKNKLIIENKIFKNLNKISANESLLTMEITPIKANNLNYKPPIEIIANLSTKPGENSSDCDIDIRKSGTEVITVNENNEDSEIVNSRAGEDVGNKNMLKALEKRHRYIERKLSKQNFQHKVSKFLANGPKSFRFGYSTIMPSKTAIAWNSSPTKINALYGDALLARDSLDKMLGILSNQYTRKLSKKEKAKAKKARGLNKNLDASRNEDTTSSEAVPTEEAVAEKNSNNIDSNITTDVNSRKRTKPLGKRGRKHKNVEDVKNNVVPDTTNTAIYCCWSREKLETKKEPKESHYCPLPICICCCRNNLIEKSFQGKSNVLRKRSGKKESVSDNVNAPTPKINMITGQNDEKVLTKKKHLNIALHAPIVLSDDENDNDDLQGPNKIASGSHMIESAVDSISSSIPPQKRGKITNNTCTSIVNTTPPKICVKTLSALNNTISSSQTSPDTSSNSPLKLFEEDSNKGKIKVGALSVSNLNNSICSFETHATESGKKSKEIYLRDTSFNDRLSKAPIFLGKNMILLSSSKHYYREVLEKKKIETENQYVLPPGVNIALLPSGELALSIDPGVEIPPNELNNLYNILSAVQQQLGGLGSVNNIEINNGEVPKITTECTEDQNKVINMDDVIRKVAEEENVIDKSNITINTKNLSIIESSYEYTFNNIPTETVCNEVISDNANKVINIENTDNEVLSETERNINKVNTESFDDKLRNENVNKEDTANIANVVPLSSELMTTETTKMQKSDDEVSKEDATKIVNDAQANEEMINTKTSILSDLMEMSGISEKDVVTDSKVSSNKLQDLLTSPQRPLSSKTVVINAKRSNKLVNPPSSDIFINHHPLVLNALEKYPDLNIVSSFIELKSFYDKKFQFYKMDLVTGQILAINLEIRKHKENKMSPPLKISESVIDLTDEQEVEFTEVKTPEKISPNKTEVKPIKLFRSIYPSLEKKRSLLIEPLKSKYDGQHGRNDIIRIIRRLRKKPQILQKKDKHGEKEITEGETDDCTSKSTTTRQKRSRKEVLETRSSDSDSDDEPLSKIASRKRETDKHNIISETRSTAECSPLDLNTDETIEEGSYSKKPPIEELEHDNSAFIEESSNEAQPEYLMHENSAMLFEQNNEDSEEVCILGV